MSSKKYSMNIKNFFLHLHTVNKHRFKVFCLCCKMGMVWRGLVHDLSKYSPVEFLEGVKYYSGDHSPIKNCKVETGYSKAWLHHKGRNKHHYEYWYDYDTPIETPFMPFPYFLEMICDNLAAGLVYQGKNWTKEYQLSYWNRVKDKAHISKHMKELLTEVYTEISIKGINQVLNKKFLKEIYEKYRKKEEKERILV